ncbi:MAG: ASKHA domain-containing protein [Lachnospiraceae bacterium]|nr:ASKHA domain-containing protein [Lachnospiraceae bacterium]
MNKAIRIIKTDGTELQTDRERVFRQINCDRENPLYDEYLSEYEVLLPEVISSLSPAAALAFAPYPEGIGGSIVPGTEVLYVITTLGEKASALIDGYFKSGAYVKGMLSDAIANAVLYSFDKFTLSEIRKMCREKHIGISKRYEAPAHLPLDIQRTAFQVLDAGKTLGLSITSGNMYDPVKSSCQVFVTTGNERVMRLTHNCSDCPDKDCPDRHEAVTVKVADPGGEYEFTAVSGSLLSDVLMENNIRLNLLCGGTGRCGKCAVKIIKGAEPGISLSCRTRIYEDVTVEMLQQDEGDMVSIGSETADRTDTPKDSPLGIAIDIGTTTLAFSLVDKERGKVINTFTAVNSQRKYGADVISRIDAAGRGLSGELKKLIESDLYMGICELKAGIPDFSTRLETVCIAGNTAMLHILLGYPAASLGVFPFETYSLSLEERALSEVLSLSVSVPDELKNVKTFILPGNSAFIGADIISGLYSLDLHKKTGINAFIDLGTNGEMAVGNKDRLLFTSAAAGPAFEGGNITYGTASIKGAVSSLKISGDRAKIATIGNEKVLSGICGTGVIEITAELLKAGLMDDTGVLADRYFDDGYPLGLNGNGDMITFTESDIREIQLAKSAIRAGIETMLLRYGAGYDDIEKLYIAGGFGCFLNTEKAAYIGMIPKELSGKAVAAGNTSLEGAIKFILNVETAGKEVTDIAGKGEEIILSNDSDFNEMYLKYMMFER